MAYPSLVDRERAALDTTAHARMQKQGRDAADQAEASRAGARRGLHERLKTVLRLGTDALALVYRRDETGKRIDTYVATNSELDDGDLIRTVLKLLVSFPYVAAVAGIDFLLLSAGASLFLSLAGITAPWAVLVGKIVLPFFIVFWEVASAVHGYRNGSKPSALSFVIPCVIALLAGMTYLAHEGVTSLADVTFFTIGLLIVVIAFGFLIHYFVIVLAPRVIEGFAYLSLAALRRVYQKVVVAVEEAIGEVYAALLDYLHDIEEYNHCFDQDEVPRFDRIPEQVRVLINQHVGAEVIPPPDAPAFRGNGVS